MFAATVIIPCRNKLATLREVLRGLQQQSFPHDRFDVLVVDDGSTDGTPAFVEGLAAAGGAPRISLLRVPPHDDVCPGMVRNHGLARAEGEIVIFLDADVLVGPELVAEHVATQRARPGALVGYVYAYPLAAADRTPEKMKAPPIGEVLARLPDLLREDPKHWKDGRETHYRIWPDMDTCPMPWLFFWGGNSSLPLALARELGGFDEAFKNWGFEDVELGYRLWKRGVPFTLRREAWGFHYPHPTGSDDRRFLNLYQFLRKHPEPYAELNTFASTRFQQPGAARVRWEVLDRLAAPPAPVPAPPADLTAALVQLARARSGGPVAWFGPWEGAPGAVELVSRPFHRDAAGGIAALAGLALPHEDGAFGTALAVDYWHTLSPAARHFVRAELTRVAGQCLFVSTSGAALEPGSDWTVEPVPFAGAQVQRVLS